MSISIRNAMKFINDEKGSDLIAIQNLLRETCNPTLEAYLMALLELNKIMIQMENETIPWGVEFNGFYRKGMELIHNYCERIVSNNMKEIDGVVAAWYDIALANDLPVSPSDIKDFVIDLYKLKEEKRRS